MKFIIFTYYLVTLSKTFAEENVVEYERQRQSAPITYSKYSSNYQPEGAHHMNTYYQPEIASHIHTYYQPEAAPKINTYARYTSNYKAPVALKNDMNSQNAANNLQEAAPNMNAYSEYTANYGGEPVLRRNGANFGIVPQLLFNRQHQNQNQNKNTLGQNGDLFNEAMKNFNPLNLVKTALKAVVTAIPHLLETFPSIEPQIDQLDWVEFPIFLVEAIIKIITVLLSKYISFLPPVVEMLSTVWVFIKKPILIVLRQLWPTVQPVVTDIISNITQVIIQKTAPNMVNTLLS